MKAIILAAGASTRTYPLTLTRPKPVLPLRNGTILDYTLNLLRDMAKIDEVVLVVNYKKEKIIEHFGDSYKGMKLTYVDQQEPKGTGHAVLCTEYVFEDYEDSILILNGDDIYSREDISRIIEKYPKVAIRKVNNPSSFGIFEFKNNDGRLIATGLEEKPRYPKSDLANVGCYHFGKDIFKYLKRVKPSSRGEIEITDAIMRYIDWNDLELMQILDFWIPVGYPWDLLTANEFLSKQNGNHPKPIIAESADIRKNVEITGYSIIGENVVIGNDCKITNSIIMDGASIGQNSVIKDSIIGENVKIDRDFNAVSFSEKRILSAVKGNYVEVSRENFGCAIGDNTKISKKVTILPGVKIWPDKDIYNVTEIKEDIH